MKKRGRPAFEFRHVAASVDARGHVAAMCFEFSLSLPCIRPWRRHVSSPPTVKLYWCTRRAHGGVVRVAPERLPAPARQYRMSNTLIVRLGVCFHCGKYLRARLVLVFMRASDHSSSRFMPSCRSARSSPRHHFRWENVAPGRYASLERACFSRRSGRPRWRVRKAAACTEPASRATAGE